MKLDPVLKQEALSMVKHTTDAFSFGVVLATLTNILPSIAALFTIIWTAIRIAETDTVRGWFHLPPKGSPPAD
jgi:hypothetical protein